MNDISLLIRIQAPRARVYELLASTEGIAQWFTQAKSRDYVEGGKISLIFPDEEIDFNVTTLSKAAKVVWHCVSHNNPWFATDIIFDLQENSGSTTVRFDHAGWPEVDDFFRDCNMSWAYFLESLRLCLEEGEGTPEGVAPPCESGAS